MADEEIERWITIKGNHIPILKGESEGDAINRFFSKFDDTDDTEIDIELDDEDKKVKYDTIYFTSVGYQDSIVNPEDIDKITANGYRVREMDITKEMKDLMDEYLNSKYIDDNNMAGLMTEFRNKIRFLDIQNGTRGILSEYFRRMALNKCAEKADEFLKTLPKLENNSIDVSYRQANANGWVESHKYAYGTTEREWYTSNCQRCIIAYEMRRRGYNVEANKYTGNRDPIYNTHISMTRAFLGYDSFIQTKEYDKKPSGEKYANKKQLVKAMEKDMLDQPEGARFVLSWNWKNYKYGHTINAEKVDGKIKLYDAQTGTEHTIDDIINGTSGLGGIRVTTLQMTRVDNLKLSKRLEALVKW